MSINPLQQNQYKVNIDFTDGSYLGTVTCADERIAYTLCLQDARMGATNGSFFGTVVFMSVTLENQD